LSIISAERALIFRITHIDNVAWALANGLHCQNSGTRQPNYRQIGNPDLIGKRASRVITIAPGGSLSNYIPFYFTPYSPMLYNIKTGYGGIQQVPLDEIVIFVTSLPRLVEKQVPFVFSDRHAYLATAEFFNDTANLNRIDWTILTNRDFRRDPSDPGKVERYQAEALVHRHLPCDALIGVICRNDAASARVQREVDTNGVQVQVLKRPAYYL
jgi:hypothetical protein